MARQAQDAPAAGQPCADLGAAQDTYPGADLGSKPAAWPPQALTQGWRMARRMARCVARRVAWRKTWRGTAPCIRLFDSSHYERLTCSCIRDRYHERLCVPFLAL
ncbi:hypothetical protein KL86DES1_21090 [uncultured Desulfovibrio sp.]|uniref:Uncharacterized protein n=1 Tax=uncultured Desulfovibrio sp. TaxID=167968 RepID=A0A212L6G4_9BACT|nr:hypothetical protein KL86DES1_21090 [uncultured Desulfovibrio sp.]